MIPLVGALPHPVSPATLLNIVPSTVVSVHSFQKDTNRPDCDISPHISLPQPHETNAVCLSGSASEGQLSTHTREMAATPAIGIAVASHKLPGLGRHVGRAYPASVPRLDVRDQPSDRGSLSTKSQMLSSPSDFDRAMSRGATTIPLLSGMPTPFPIHGVLPPREQLKAIMADDRSGKLSAPRGCAVDATRDLVVVANTGRNCLTLFELSTGRHIRDVGK